jgi:hypothetical protein
MKKVTTVRCPNMCDSGQIKHYPDSTKALYINIECPYCRGAGNVDEKRAKAINVMI